MTEKIPKDPVMCLSFVNTRLRDCYSSFCQLCREMEADEEEISLRLSQIGYTYDEKLNQFR